MSKGLIRRFYRMIPGLRELAQVRDLFYELRRDLLQIRTDLLQIRTDLVGTRVHEFQRFLDFRLPEHPRYGDPLRLTRYEFPVCSQNGEDGVIREIFRRVGTTDRTFVEIGVGDGKQNNTAFLLAQGWKGFWIDGARGFLEAIEKTRDPDEGRLKWAVSMVTRENAASILEQLGVPREFDLLSIDIDQNTYYAWEGLRNYRPRVIVIEYNGTIPPDLDWKVNYVPDRVWDGTHNFGASLKAFESLGRELGYSLVGCEFTGLNAFFVHDDLVGDRFAEPFTSENHYEPARYTVDYRRGHRIGILDRLRPDEPAPDDSHTSRAADPHDDPSLPGPRATSRR
jgi:hypothetical protein